MAKIFDALSDSQAADLLTNGKVGIIPTDTVYGLVCMAKDQAAVQRLYSLKKRDKKPGTIIAADVNQLVSLGIKARYLKPVEHYWPNPISIVMPNFELSYLHLGVGSLALRIPDDKNLQKLLKTTGPLLTTSANEPGKPEATDISQAQKYFGDTVDFYVDGGDLSGRQSSTIIRIVDDMVEVLRTGAVKIDETGRIIK